MPTEKKEKIVAGLQGIFAKATVGVMTDYRGLTTAEINDLRHRLRGPASSTTSSRTRWRSSPPGTPAWSRWRPPSKTRRRWPSATARRR